MVYLLAGEEVYLWEGEHLRAVDEGVVLKEAPVAVQVQARSEHVVEAV